jgi:hypothetical protein
MTVLVICLVFLPVAAGAQNPVTSLAAQPNGNAAVNTVKFLAGGVLALAMHESGHLIFDAAFDAQPRIKRVQFGPFPFFAITHRSDLSPRREFTVSSAGFWVQNGTSEALLTRHPDLRHEHAPVSKGILAFNILTSIGYGTVALAKAGPFERDTRGMAIRTDERAIGVIVMTPAVFDAIRYFKPEARWAVWASRAAKVGTVLLVVR